MKVDRRVGIWMDHSVAHVMEYVSDDYTVKTIEAEFSMPVHQDGMLHSENSLHNKKSQSNKMFYNALEEVIKDYDVVLLYGPTEAKNELKNLIRSQHKFDAIKIETKSAEKMSFNQQHAFIKEYFSKLLNYENPYFK
jgi:hypothetical protein